jgi:RimJ/RimL family protein N-acetyltransferase
MGGRVRARLLRRGDRDEVLAHLARNALDNLLLLDLADRIGGRPAPGELRAELAAAWRDGHIEGVVGLRPSVVLAAGVTAEALDAFLPYLETLGVGLVKSSRPAVDRLWERLCRRRRRRALVDRIELAYALRPERAARAGPGHRRARPATDSDLEDLVVAARESLREEQRPDPFEGDVRSFRRWVRGRVPRARVLESEGRIVFVGYADVQRPEGWLVQGVYTWPDMRGRGFATAGVSDLCREAFASGADHVQLAVVADNLAGKRLYEGLGFERFDELRTILFSDL